MAPKLLQLSADSEDRQGLLSSVRNRNLSLDCTRHMHKKQHTELGNPLDDTLLNRPTRFPVTIDERFEVRQAVCNLSDLVRWRKVLTYVEQRIKTYS